MLCMRKADKKLLKNNNVNPQASENSIDVYGSAHASFRRSWNLVCVWKGNSSFRMAAVSVGKDAFGELFLPVGSGITKRSKHDEHYNRSAAGNG